jgi:multidrug resistance protein, MATE family
MTYKPVLLTALAEIRQFFKLAVPLIASEVIFALSGFFATVMIADLGNEALAAHAIVWNIYLTLILFFIGILFSISILVSQSFGAKDSASIKICFNQGILLAIISTPIMIAIMKFCPLILVWTNQDSTIIKLATPAFNSFLWTILPLTILIVLEQFFIGINKAYLVTAVSILSVPIQLFFFYVLLFGKFGFPKLGLASIGYGLAISHYLIAIPFLLYLFFSKQFKIYNLFKDWWKINLKFFFELIQLGLPLGIMFAFEVGLFAAIAIMMGKLGTNILAAYQISYQYFMIALVILFGLIQATTVRVGIEVGRNNRRSLRFGVGINIVVGLAIMMCFSCFYIYLPKLAISLDIDINDPQLQELVITASKFLSAVGILILVDCIRLMSTGALRGLKDTKIPTMISFIGFWCIAFPMAYLLGFKFKLGGIGIWWGLIIGLSVSATILFFRFNRMSKHINLEALITKADRNSLLKKTSDG